jgi:iron(III) transport system ATP-binding protein
MNTLEIKNLHKKFPGTQAYAVRDFSLEVARGEIMALLGESGCGKTTILRMIAGFETPTRGEILLNGEVVSSDRLFVEPGKRGVGIVFQDYALFPHKTVWENICFGLFRHGREERSEKAVAIIQLAGLQGLEQRYPHQLSGGQKQRVALARALAPEPGIILFDEPFSNLDSMRKTQMREDIRDIIRKSGATAVFVTHDTRDVLAIADRVAVIRDGVNLQTGPPGEVYAHPTNPYVARFFGKTNLMRGVIAEGGYQTPIGFIPADLPLPASMKEVMLSIRPGHFEPAGEEEGCFCGRIKRRSFLGEYLEVVCAVKGPGGQETEVVIHAPPGHDCDSGICHFRYRGDRHPGVMG